MKHIIILCLLCILSCNNAKDDKKPKAPVGDVLLKDYNKFLMKEFPDFGDFSNLTISGYIKLTDFNLSNDKILTSIVGEIPFETFILWRKEGEYYKCLFKYSAPGDRIQDVSEIDLNDDGKQDLMIRSCLDETFSYIDILINQTKVNQKNKLDYKSYFKSYYVNPLVLDLNNDNYAEIIFADVDKFPFDLYFSDLAKEDNTYIFKDSTLYRFQKKVFAKGFNLICNSNINTPLLINYPIVIYNIAKNGIKVDVTKNFPDLLKAHIESIYYSDIKVLQKNNFNISRIWKNYILTYLDSYYQLGTDSSYIKYLDRRMPKDTDEFND